MNQCNGYFELSDSIFYSNGFSVIQGDYLDSNNYIDLYGRYVIGAVENIAVIYNYALTQFDSTKIFFTNDDSSVDVFSSGDIDSDGDNDIVFSCNNDFFWGIIYNDGAGSFTAPEYNNLSFPPVHISCADLNDDGRADVVVCGSDTEIYFSTSSGFQQQILTNTLSHDILISDFDNDGDNDIITHTTFIYPNHRVYFFENLGNNDFIEQDYFQFSPFCQYGQTSDLNNDSLPDMIFSAQDNSGLHIYYNQGNFQLGDHLYIPIETNNAMLRRVNCADFDGNSFNDILLVKSWGAPYEGNAMFLFNDGQGEFVENPITKILESTLNNQHQLSCYPNPFKKNTQIWYILENESKVQLCVYNSMGQIIRTINEATKTKGNHYIDFDANGLKNGIYFYSININGKTTDSKKMTIMK